MAGRNFDAPWPRTPTRLVGTGLVRLYQLTFSSWIGGHCRHLPTCSEYAYEGIARHGLWAGGWLTVGRVARCGPFGSHGFDPVPERRPAHWRAWWPPTYLRRTRVEEPAERG